MKQKTIVCVCTGVCTWNGSVHIEWECAYGMGICIGNGIVHMKWECAHGTGVCIWNGSVHMGMGMCK